MLKEMLGFNFVIKPEDEGGVQEYELYYQSVTLWFQLFSLRLNTAMFTHNLKQSGHPFLLNQGHFEVLSFCFFVSSLHFCFLLFILPHR